MSWALRRFRDSIPSRLFIVAVAMEQLAVVGHVGSAACAGDLVIHFHHVVHGREKQSTPGTPPALPFEQVGPAGRQLRVTAESACPVQEVAVVGAGICANFDVSHDGHLVVEAQTRISATPEH